MYKYVLLAGIIGLTACGATTTGAIGENEANISSSEVNGQMVATGLAGSSFSETEISDFIVVPECDTHGLGVASMTVTPNSDGTFGISAICA